MSNHPDQIAIRAQEPTDLQARLSKLRHRAASEGRSRAVREIDLAIEQARSAAKDSGGDKRA